MKKILLILLGLVFTTSLNAQATVTTSNKAVFDGENLAFSRGESALKVGNRNSVGAELKFSTQFLANINHESYSFEIVGNSNSGLSFNSSRGYTAFSLAGSESPILNAFDISGRGFLSLTNPNSQLTIGSYIDFNSDNKLIVSSGNSFFDGNVGIGTDTHIDPVDNREYKLSVDGDIRAHAVKVYTTWADYVFENNYDLLSLEEVDKFIKKNGHLKDIPSAKVVENNGIELGEMNKLLLQKIEELTLYLIDHQKTIIDNQKTIEELKTDIETLKKR